MQSTSGGLLGNRSQCDTIVNFSYIFSSVCTRLLSLQLNQPTTFLRPWFVITEVDERWKRTGKDGGREEREECTSSDPMICTQTSPL